LGHDSLVVDTVLNEVHPAEMNRVTMTTDITNLVYLNMAWLIFAERLSAPTGAIEAWLK
jgi:hypothetical protein